MNPLKMLSRGGAVSEPSDADFENVTLLLHGDGTNGAQNNTFLDSSTNNFTITRNGNTTQGTFSPFSKVDGRWGNYFDNSGDYLQISSNAAFSFGTSDFTIECWFNASTLNAVASATDGIITMIGSVGLYIASDAIRVTQAGVAVLNDFSATLVTNTWYHLAITRSGTSMRAFVNGVQTGSTYTNSTNFSSTGNVRIGTETTQDFHGYISNLRVVKGTAVYTSAFTPPTTPLTAITNTSLLTCQSNRFKDNSSNNFTITANGDVKVTPFSPFPTLTAYSAATNGGSGYFDGSGDYLNLGNQTQLHLGSGDFTLEAWIYKNTNTAYMAMCGDFALGNSNTVQIIGDAGGTKICWYDGATNAFTITSSATINIGAWTHVSFVRSGTTLSLYVNGSLDSTATLTTNYNATTAFYIGNTTELLSARFWNGYISNLRIIKGSAVTPPAGGPTAPLTAVTNTQLLCNFTNAGILDHSMSNNLETVGNAQIDTTTKKYGTGALEFDGNGDWLLLPASPDMAMGTGDFTWEAWIYATAASDQSIYECRSTASTTDGFTITAFSSTVIRVFTNGVLVTATVSNYLNTWTHVAFTRSGSTNRLFINGTLENTATNSNNYSSQVGIVGGGRYAGGTTISASFTGFIDDLRITKGKARYTSNFTPPTAAFEDIGT